MVVPYGDQVADNQQIRNGIQAQASGRVAHSFTLFVNEWG
jgi:hypothetical protein